MCTLIGGACLWSIRELKEQRTRVQKDRFPQNKKRSQNASAQGKISEAIIIRPIQKKDNGQLSSIIRTIFEEFGAPKENSVYSDKATDFLFETFSENKKSEYFVAEQNGKILGGCGYFPTEGLPADCAEIVKFYLCPDSRGMKIGTKLFSLAEECAKLAGYKKLYIESFPQFSSAVSMYKKKRLYRTFFTAWKFRTYRNNNSLDKRNLKSPACHICNCKSILCDIFYDCIFVWLMRKFIHS